MSMKKFAILVLVILMSDATVQAAEPTRFKFKQIPVLPKSTPNACQMGIGKGIHSWSTPGNGPPKFYMLTPEITRSPRGFCLWIDRDGNPVLELGNSVNSHKLKVATKEEIQRLCGTPMKIVQQRIFRYFLFGWNGKTWNKFLIDLEFSQNNLLKAYRVEGVGISDKAWHTI